MPETPEAQARKEIDRLLGAAGWHVCDVKDANIHAARGVALREFALAEGYGHADYLLYVDGKAAGVIEAKKMGTTLTGVENLRQKFERGISLRKSYRYMMLREMARGAASGNEYKSKTCC